MKLLSKETYKQVEYLLYNSSTTNSLAIVEIINFFSSQELYNTFLQVFYLNRKNYKNRYPDNRSLFRYLQKLLYVEEPTLYNIRKDIIYKSAMIFYKYDILN